MKNQTTKDTTTVEEIITITENSCDNPNCIECSGSRRAQILKLIQNEREKVLEEVEVNLPKADLEEARKHRPDNSIGFMLGWNAYSDKLKEKLAALASERKLKV